MSDPRTPVSRREFFNSGLNLMGAALTGGALGNNVHMNRDSSLASSVAGLVDAARVSDKTAAEQSFGGRLHTIQHPLALTMWDFSWLERRWPGAGYEDWDLALDELVLTRNGELISGT